VSRAKYCCRGLLFRDGMRWDRGEN
jgi:hypothetical protein